MTDAPLYPKAMLRLAADAHGAGTLPQPDGMGSAHNPACGDRVTVALTLADGQITRLVHHTQACILTQASAALLADQAPGLDANGIARLAAQLRAWLGGTGEAPSGYGVFEGVAGHAGRHVCVLLPFRAALAALEQAQEGGQGTERQADTVQPG